MADEGIQGRLVVAIAVARRLQKPRQITTAPRITCLTLYMILDRLQVDQGSRCSDCQLRATPSKPSPQRKWYQRSPALTDRLAILAKCRKMSIQAPDPESVLRASWTALLG